MNDTLHTQASTADSKASDEYRLEAHVTIKHGETEGRLHGGNIQVVRVVLTDAGPYEREDGTIINPPDVICTMRPEDARRLALRALQAAERAERESTWE
jgi:hypothetical protein